MYCKDCKYWQSILGINFGDCISPKTLQEITKIGLDFYNYEDDVIITKYDESWGCITGGNYGCVHFKPRHEMSSV